MLQDALPTTSSRLQLSFLTEVDVWACTEQQQDQQVYYDQHSKALKPIATGEIVKQYA